MIMWDISVDPIESRQGGRRRLAWPRYQDGSTGAHSRVMQLCFICLRPRCVKASFFSNVDAVLATIAATNTYLACYAFVTSERAVGERR